jgi:hypothetical protein
MNDEKIKMWEDGFVVYFYHYCCILVDCDIAEKVPGFRQPSSVFWIHFSGKDILSFTNTWMNLDFHKSLGNSRVVEPTYQNLK